ncbi:MAG: hypothetical protein UY48_C0038G0031 [Candidatus Gottesmanbacteria bacterium GW2011_GWB1_49_7]|uniref:Uncharacterized protein n=1 Tax=Candidatus Gottesmanbacteria bacterium GW2011_GWB1_49_7 TaxID=1618448 RepID=A0A0G1VVD7_9BACT|nr:MAG: hypothetical protein UY48_C0038G0031 [Candidatus Gottesmanbacteria bacterium GW2011_GWB1_49_7]
MFRVHPALIIAKSLPVYIAAGIGIVAHQVLSSILL